MRKCAHSVRDDQHSRWGVTQRTTHAPECSNQLTFRAVIYRSQHIIQHDQVRAPVERASERDALALAA